MNKHSCCVIVIGTFPVSCLPSFFLFLISVCFHCCVFFLRPWIVNSKSSLVSLYVCTDQWSHSFVPSVSILKLAKKGSLLCLQLCCGLFFFVATVEPDVTYLLYKTQTKPASADSVTSPVSIQRIRKNCYFADFQLCLNVTDWGTNVMFWRADIRKEELGPRSCFVWNLARGSSIMQACSFLQGHLLQIESPSLSGTLSLASGMVCVHNQK